MAFNPVNVLRTRAGFHQQCRAQMQDEANRETDPVLKQLFGSFSRLHDEAAQRYAALAAQAERDHD